MKNFTRAGWCLLTGLLLTGTAMAQSGGKNSKSVKTTATLSNSPSSYETFVQGVRRVKPGFPVCGFSNVDANVSIPAPAAFLAARQNPNLRAAARSTFIVDYVGFSPQAQRAFQYAVDIWASIIDSPVPIRVSAVWEPLEPTVLGQASAGEFRAGVDGAQKSGSFYAVALAEKIARRDINSPTEPDIEADFNSSQRWYYGTDAKPGSGQFDLVSVVLHELGHGLGFTSLYGIPNGGALPTLSSRPAIFDNYVVNGLGQVLAATPAIINDPAALNRALTGNDVFFTGPTTQRAKLYAPRTFSDASSISHLDEDTYRQGDPNSLMSPTANTAEAIHDPGPIVKSIFTDIEWTTTSVLHTRISDLEDPKPIVFTTQVFSDTGVNTASPTLYISPGTLTPTSVFTAIPLTRVGTTNTYSYTLPVGQATGRINYYFEAKDVTGKTYSNPGKNIAGNQVTYSFQVAPDNVAPTIDRHVPRSYAFIAETDLIQLSAIVADERTANLDSVYVDYRINSAARPPVSMTYIVVSGVRDSVFVANLPIARGTLRAGDVVSYRLIAKDKSRASNRRILPASGFYSTTIVAPASTTANSYNTTFSNAAAVAADFVGDGFSITQPTGFTDAAINTPHPYANGNDIFYQTNYTYVLKTPIRIKANQDSATIRFDEIVLVEPGEGTDYTKTDFYDYVIVEGSRDGGKTWLPFINGYDSRDQTVWLTAYNTAVTTATIISGGQPAQDQISTTAGRPNLFRKREFSMLDNGNFFPNQVVLVRFRLYVDQLARGWGWAIDNLQIQTPAAPVVLATEPVRNATFMVSPNPTAGGFVRIDAELTTPTTEAALSISSPTGQTLRQQTVSVKNGTTVSESLDISQLPNGLYFLRLQAGDSVQTKKLIIVK